jgi:DNA polymerase
MTTIQSTELSIAELVQLMHFHADAGVEWLLEDAPVDRFAEFADLAAARARQDAAPAIAPSAQRRPPAPAAPQARAPAPVRGPVAIPDAEAAAEARRIAQSAVTLDELAEAVAGFGGCNLRNSARSTAFMAGNPAARIAIAAGMPSEDDDRDGVPLSGASGAMLARMLGGIGLSREDVMLFNLIPWRPPGNRQPTAHEIEICRPFGQRLIELLAPAAILALGNLPTRLLTGAPEGIHALRGRWLEFEQAGLRYPLMATFHPQDLAAVPAGKQAAWRDMLVFKSQINN